MMTRILMASMGSHFILPAPMPARFSAFGRVFSPSWSMTLLTVILFAAFVSLGRWQWHRGAAKQATWDEYERASPALAVKPHEIDTVARFAHVQLAGRYEGARQ